MSGLSLKTKRFHGRKKLASLLVVFTLALTPLLSLVSQVRAADEWHAVGDIGFTVLEDEITSSSLAINSSGTPYVAFSGIYNTNQHRVKVMRFDGTNWVNVGNVLHNAEAQDVSLAFDGNTPYVAFSDTANGGVATVMTLDGSDWVPVGDPLSAGEAHEISIVFDASIPYVAYSDYANESRATVKTFDGADWVEVGNAEDISDRGGDSLSVAFDSEGAPYVAFSGDLTDSEGAVIETNVIQVKKFDSGSWVAVANQGQPEADGFMKGAGGVTSIALDSTDTPYVAHLAYQEGSDPPLANDSVIVSRYDSTDWQFVKSADDTHLSNQAGDYISLVFNEGAPYVVFQDDANGQKATMKTYDGTDWAVVGVAGFSEGVATDLALDFNDTTPYVAYIDGANDDGLTVMKYGTADEFLPPVVTLSGTPSVFTQDGPPVAVDPGVSVSDDDSLTLASATVSITGNFQAGQDVLAYTNDGSTMGNITGAYDSGTGILTLTSAGSLATISEWQAALRAVTYDNNADPLNTSQRTIGFLVIDETDTSSILASKSLNVIAETVAPTVTSVSTPGGGSVEYYGLGETIEFTVNFDEEVIVDTAGGTPYLEVNTVSGSPIQAPYTGGSGTSALVFGYTVASDDDDRVDSLGASIVTSGATLQDAAGNDANLTLHNVQDVDAIQYDGIAPEILSISRGDDSPTNASSVTYEVQFDDSVENVDISDFMVTLTGTATGTIVSVDGENSSYTVTVDSVTGDGTLRLDLNDSGTSIVDFGTENPINGGYTEGEVYTIDNTAPPAPTASPTAGSYTSAQTVTLSDSEGGVDIYYTTDGSTPDSTKVLYTGALTVASSQTVKAIAYDEAGNVSGVLTAVYVIDGDGPVISSIGATSDISGDKATITWMTDEPGSSQLVMGIATDAIDTIYAETNTAPRVTSHDYSLTNLMPCTVYYYQIRSEDALGNQTASGTNSFVTDGCAGPVTAHAEKTITASGGGTLTLGSVTVTVPAGFIDTGSATIQIKRMNAGAAKDNIGKPEGLLLVGGHMYDIEILSTISEPAEGFLLPISTSFSYTASDLAGIDQDTLAIHHYHDTDGWTKLGECTTDAAARKVTCETDGFSTFALAAVPVSSGVPNAPNTGLPRVKSAWLTPMMIVGGSFALTFVAILFRHKFSRAYEISTNRRHRR